MATRQRLRELAYSDMNKECAVYEMLCSTTKTRKISDVEMANLKAKLAKEQVLNKYRRNGAVNSYWGDKKVR